MSLTLSSEKLTNSEKMSILNGELKRNNIDMNVDVKKQCIANFSGLIGFPQCCSLFAGDKDLFGKGPNFFESPCTFLVNNIMNLKANSFLSLAFLFCNGKIEEENLSPSEIKKSKKYLPVLEELASYLNILFNESAMTSLIQSYYYYSGLYVKRKFSYEYHSGMNVRKSWITFSHATVYEAVGQVIGDRFPEMLVKYGHPGYLYWRTYTAEAKDSTSQNVFIPVSVYGLLAERIVHYFVQKGIVWSWVKHSAFKQNQFLMKLKEELYRVNRIRDFFMANRLFKFIPPNLSEGECNTFLQDTFQSDKDTVKLVYSHFMEVLACTHNNKIYDCWQCKEKQSLLELALYYRHFEIADKLITMNACYTHVSLCNAARHGDIRRVQTILEYIKRTTVFNPEYIEAKKSLCRAFISENQDVIEILLQEGITLDSTHLIDVVLHGDINALMKVVEHLKCQNNWDPQSEENKETFYSPDMYADKLRNTFYSDFIEMPCSIALHITYCNGKFEMADYLLNNKVKISLKMLAYVSKCCSQQVVARVIQNLKDAGTWDTHCDKASKLLENAFTDNINAVVDLLIQEGVSLTMKNLYRVVQFRDSLELVKKIIQYLKDTNSWDSKCDHASKALEYAYHQEKYDLCDVLIQEEISLTMKTFPDVIIRFRVSLESVEKAIQHLKDTGNWDPKCDHASKALEDAYKIDQYDVCHVLIKEGVSMTMKNFSGFISGYSGLATELRVSLESVKKAIQHLKDTDSWDPKCDHASQVLEVAYSNMKYDVCDVLIQEEVSLTMKNLPGVIQKFKLSFEPVQKVIQHLKDTDSLDSKCDRVFEALTEAYWNEQYDDVFDLLIKEGISLTMKSLSSFISKCSLSMESVQKAIKHMKHIESWDPKCDHASEALINAYRNEKYDVCNVLIQEGVSLRMKNVPSIIFELSFESVQKAIKHMKDRESWDPKCDDASVALCNAYSEEKYDVCDLLIKEGVSLTMKNLLDVVGIFTVSMEYVHKVIQQLKDTGSWDPKCDHASKTLEEAYAYKQYGACCLLIHEGVSLTIKTLPCLVSQSKSLESVKKAIQHLKDSESWDPTSDDASKALEKAYRRMWYSVCHLLIEEGVSLTMKNLAGITNAGRAAKESIEKAIQHLKDADSWDPKCDHASKALEKAYRVQTDVGDWQIWNGGPLTMNNFMVGKMRFQVTSLETVKKAIQHLKDNGSWDPKCNYASKALEKAYSQIEFDVCDLLVHEEVSLTVMYFPGMILKLLDYVKTAVTQLKDADSCDHKCDHPSKALEKASSKEQYVVCDLLIQEGVSLTMKNFTGVISTFKVSLESVFLAISHFKDTDSWDPKCDYASKALEEAYYKEQYHMCHLLIKEGVSLTMKNLTGVISTLRVSMESVQKVIQHLKDTGSWDPKCDHASKALEEAYSNEQYDMCHLLIQEGVSLTMKNVTGVISTFKVSLESVMKAIQHLKDTESWNQKCDHASKELEKAYGAQMCDVCHLLIQEECPLTMKNFPGVKMGFQVSLESVKRAMQHLKDIRSWDPKCTDASIALEEAYRVQKYDVCDLLIQEGVALAMKNFHGIITGLQVSLESVKKAIQYLKDTNQWDPLSDHAVNSLAKSKLLGVTDIYITC